MRIRRNSTFLAVLLFSVALAGVHISALAADAVLDQARELIAKRDAKAAFDLLSPLEQERAGNPDFDYLLGIAALDSGNVTRAIFALERVLAVNPNHPQARAEIARAYFVAGETQTAKREFEAVRNQRPPPEVVATIDKFLDAIERSEASNRPQFRGYLEATFGHDTNVNQATANSQVAVPAFGGVATLTRGSTENSDYFGNLAGGASFRYPLDPTLAVVGGVNLSGRFNNTQDQFDTGILAGNLGIVSTQGDDIYTAALQGEAFDVDSSRFRNAAGGVLQWQHNLSTQSQASAYFQYTDLHYPGQDLRDAQRYVGGVAYARALGGDYQPVFYVGGYFGSEDERANGVPEFGHDLYGVRVGGQLSLRSNIVLFGAASYENRRYGGPDPFFFVTREDKQSNLNLGVNYTPLKNWIVTPQVGYTNNSSNIVIDDYNRTIISVSLRRQFE